MKTPVIKLLQIYFRKGEINQEFAIMMKNSCFIFLLSSLMLMISSCSENKNKKKLAMIPQ